MTLTTTTNPVSLKVSSLVGQVTFLSSSLTSLKKLTGLYPAFEVDILLKVVDLQGYSNRSRVPVQLVGVN